MLIKEISFGSLKTYSPNGVSSTDLESKKIIDPIKNNDYIDIDSKQVLTSDYLAKFVKEHLKDSELENFFANESIFIPIPSSTVTKYGKFWNTQDFANALVSEGIGKRVEPCLERYNAVKKSSTSESKDRPKAIDHYESMKVCKPSYDLKEIILIDDVVTRGATLLGAANIIAEMFPNANIKGFAFMRAISNPREFVKINKPCVGKITLQDDGGTLRRP